MALDFALVLFCQNLTGKRLKERISHFPLEMWLVAGWVETPISSDLWGTSLKNKEIGFQQNNFLRLEMFAASGN